MTTEVAPRGQDGGLGDAGDPQSIYRKGIL